MSTEAAPVERLHWRGAASPLCNEHTLPLTLMRDVQPTNVHSTSERASPPTPAPAGSASVRVGGRYVVRSDLRTADGALARGADVSVHPAVPLCVRIVDGSRCEIATLLFIILFTHTFPMPTRPPLQVRL